MTRRTGSGLPDRDGVRVPTPACVGTLPGTPAVANPSADATRHCACTVACGLCPHPPSHAHTRAPARTPARPHATATTLAPWHPQLVDKKTKAKIRWVSVDCDKNKAGACPRPRSQRHAPPPLVSICRVAPRAAPGGLSCTPDGAHAPALTPLCSSCHALASALLCPLCPHAGYHVCAPGAKAIADKAEGAPAPADLSNEMHDYIGQCAARAAVWPAVWPAARRVVLWALPACCVSVVHPIQ